MPISRAYDSSWQRSTDFALWFGMCGPPGSPPPARSVPQALASSLVPTSVLGQARRVLRRGAHTGFMRAQLGRKGPCLLKAWATETGSGIISSILALSDLSPLAHMLAPHPIISSLVQPCTAESLLLVGTLSSILPSQGTLIQSREKAFKKQSVTSPVQLTCRSFTEKFHKLYCLILTTTQK